MTPRLKLLEALVRAQEAIAEAAKLASELEAADEASRTRPQKAAAVDTPMPRTNRSYPPKPAKTETDTKLTVQLPIAKLPLPPPVPRVDKASTRPTAKSVKTVAPAAKSQTRTLADPDRGYSFTRERALRHVAKAYVEARGKAERERVLHAMRKLVEQNLVTEDDIAPYFVDADDGPGNTPRTSKK